MYKLKRALLVVILLGVVAPGIIKADSKSNQDDCCFSFSLTNSCSETHPELQICGNFFSFETRGGATCDPSSSAVSGQGGIFVDHNGAINIGKQYRANVGTMVTKSSNGIVNLPKNQVFFDNRVGVTNWDLNLNDPLQEVIVGPDECFSGFTLNWRETVKDFELFCPYVVDNTNACDCPPVLPCNVIGVPIVEGCVGQLQLEGSTIASPVTVKVSGGSVGELVFFPDNDVSDVPVGVLIVENDARVGVGSVQINADSLFAQIRLGINGLTIIANGDGWITLNQDIIIDNVCSILKGPDFSSGSETQNVIHFNSAGCCRTLRITETGILDLRSFGFGDVIEFGGELNIIFEPGAKVLMNGVTLRVVENACIKAETYPLTSRVFTQSSVDDVQVTDPFRVKLIGMGTIQLNDCACFLVEPDAFVGVETLFEVLDSNICEFATTSDTDCDMVFTQTCEIPTTNIIIDLNGNAQFIIGTDCATQAGGSFQVGNTVDRPGHSVIFTLSVNDVCAQAIIRKGGFLGLNLGIVNKLGVPSDWLVDSLFNVDSIAIDVTAGLFAHDRIFSTDSSNSSVLGIGETLGSPVFSLSYGVDGLIHGGGNLVLFTASCQGPQHPIVRIDDDIVDGSCLRVGILASKPLLPPFGPINVDAVTFFESIKTLDIEDEERSQSLSNIASPAAQCPRANKVVRAGFVLNDEIIRTDITDITGPCPCLQLVQAIEDGAAIARVTDFDNPEDASFFSNI